ncbi:hypothetical protein [Hymenobacter sediminicola]|uniref:DUF4384 domain-containing protein n=1 Tax=Hymenobacter sediminicola TaxID=2761579 RepID=A0A7G7W2I1_9BACT|nr:hypothetical protein [Hymenobacter sediminicola]QNH60574.1 hypothetical protein H4317_10200 [Hymenobacter sediminicola]
MMNRIMRFGVLVLGLLAGSVAGFGQPAGSGSPSAAELKKNIALVSSKGEEDGGLLIAKTARQVALYLLFHELSAAEAKKLGLYLSVDSKDAAQFRVYLFNYHSGGTRGQVNVPVMQWKNQAGQLFSYAPALEAGFYEIHKLKSPGRKLYLLLADEQGSSRCMQRIAYVVELKGNYLLLDAPAFDQSPYLSLCDVPMEFDARQQLLRLDVTEFDFYYYEPQSEPYRLLTRWGFRSLEATPRLALKFNGQRFSKP